MQIVMKYKCICRKNGENIAKMDKNNLLCIQAANISKFSVVCSC